MVIYAFGCCIGYQIFIGELLEYLCGQIWPSDVKFFGTFEFRLCANGPIAFLILLPLSLKRDMSSLAFMGIVSIGALFYVLIVMLVEVPFYWKENRNKPETVMDAFILDANILTSFSLVFFAFTC